MRTISADYNATTPDGDLRLNSRASLDDLREAGKSAGDWAWFSDGEILVGGRLRDDPYWGTVATPDWETMVPLDDEEAQEIRRVWGELRALLSQSSRSPEEEARVFRLSAQADHISPAVVRDVRPGYLAFLRARTLAALGKFGPALIEIRDARASRADDPLVDLLYLELLRQDSSELAASEAMAVLSDGEPTAIVMAAAINILAPRALEAPEPEFEAAANRTLELCERFERAPGRLNISALLLSRVHFHRGMTLLRLGRLADARLALSLAHEIEPHDAALDQATRLEAHDRLAREIAARVQSRPLIAA